MNFGTPQEMVDEYRENQPDDDGPDGCLFTIIFIIVIIVTVWLLTSIK